MGTHRLAPGTVLGRYELLLPIAQGGMATVWAARQKGSRGFSKTVAVKTMLPNLSEDPTFEQMFLDEAAIASKIHHPNVAEILDLGEQDEVLYLVMEWIDGESLSALSKQTKKLETDIPLRVAVRIVAQACAGLHAAHELRNEHDELVELVHRDVSPQNILVASSGLVKLVDFGVAKALGRSGATSAGQLKGKVPYMSPEQTRGHDVDRRTDIFAMGSVLYRVTTGYHPFIEDNDIKTMRSIASRPPIRPRVKNPSLPVELEQIIMKALEKNPERRYQTAAALEADLDKLLSAHGGPVPVEEVGGFVRTTLGERDQKRRAALRDAVRVADEALAQKRASSPSGSPTSSPPSRSSVATVSDLMLTKTATPPSFTTGAVELGDDGSPVSGDRDSGAARSANDSPDSADESTRLMPPSEANELADATGEHGEVTRAVPPLEPTVSRSGITRAEPRGGPPTFGPLSEPPIASSPTLAAVTDGTGSRNAPLRKVGTWIAAAVAILAVVALIPLVVMRRGAPSTATRPREGGASVDRASDVAESRSSDVAEPTPPKPTLEVPPPTSSASGSTFAIDELPDNGTTARRPTGAGRVGPMPSAVPTSAPATSAIAARPAEPAKPAETAKPVAPTTPTSKPWVPAVQDPGF